MTTANKVIEVHYEPLSHVLLLNYLMSKMTTPMNILYTRISLSSQSLNRQIENESQYDLVIKDKGVSGSIPFFKRPNAQKLLDLLKSGVVKQIDVHAIDRLGRNLKDILETIEQIHTYNVPIFIISQGLMTLDESTGEINPTTKLILSVMGSVAEMERNLIRERINHALSVKKLKGELLGRKRGSLESVEKFLSKPKNKKISEYLKKGYSYREIAKIVGCSAKLVGKVKAHL